jgi:Secretion system C-terminal sorting domain
MKKVRMSILLVFLSLVSIAQRSKYEVRYMVTYDESEKSYTAWVVPGYDTPNENNGSSVEKGVTAQLTIKLPKGVEITNILDIKGMWQKTPIKVVVPSTLVEAGADPNYEYYVIGKIAAETNYGEFRIGNPVPLFSFKADTNRPSSITALEPNDSFIKLADEHLSFNMGSSFYSRSGQRPSLHSLPLEQAMAPTTIENVLKDAVARMGVASKTDSRFEVTPESTMITYPNPTTDLVMIKYFSERANEQVKFELIDERGMIKYSSKIKTVLGFNSLQMSLANLPIGSYLIQSVANKKVITKKIAKVN